MEARKKKLNCSATTDLLTDSCECSLRSIYMQIVSIERLNLALCTETKLELLLKEFIYLQLKYYSMGRTMYIMSRVNQQVLLKFFISLCLKLS